MSLSSFESKLQVIQSLLRDDEHDDGVVHSSNVMQSLKLAQQVKAGIASISSSTLVDHSEFDNLESIFEQLQLTSAFIMSFSDLRIKGQLPELIEASVKVLLKSHSYQRVWEVVVYPIAVSSLQYIVSHLSRKVVTRETNLGPVTEIEMDDTTGWEDLELHIRLYQGLLKGSQLNVDIVTSLWAITVYDEDYTAVRNEDSVDSVKIVCAWSIILERCAQHINRHLRENFYNFLSQFLSSVAFQPILLSLPLSTSTTVLLVKESSRNTWIDLIMKQLPSGLEDDWTQIRYAACEVLDKLLAVLTSSSFASSLSQSTISFESLMKKYSGSILPVLCVNRFHAAPSVQSSAKHIWQTYFFAPTYMPPFGKQLVITHIPEVISYYIRTMAVAKNHMVCEAAIHALSEVMLRLDETVVSQFQSEVQDALLDCLNDDRWPVKDAACLASGRILRRFPPIRLIEKKVLYHTDTTDTKKHVDWTKAKQFLQHWQHHLVDCIWSVRENAAFAFAETLVTETLVGKDEATSDVAMLREEWIAMVWDMVRHCLQAQLLVGLGDVDDSIEILSAASTSDSASDNNTAEGVSVVRTRRPVQSKIDSFLPVDMVMAAEKRKLLKQQLQAAPHPEPDENDNKSDEITNTSTTSESEVTNYRKGWGCCVDCINLRAPFAWEVSQGALYLLRELCLLTTRSRTSSSCDAFTADYLNDHEARANLKRAHFLSTSWKFSLRNQYKYSFEMKAGAFLNSSSAHSNDEKRSEFCIGLFSLLELLRTETSVRVPNSTGSSTSKVQDLYKRHPVQHTEKLHPAVYEELPDILQALSIWPIIAGTATDGISVVSDNNRNTSLSPSMLQSFWQDLVRLLLRDLMLTEEDTSGATRPGGRSPHALRRIAAEQCLLKLLQQFQTYVMSTDDRLNKYGLSLQQDSSDDATRIAVKNPSDLFLQLLLGVNDYSQNTGIDDKRTFNSAILERLQDIIHLPKSSRPNHRNQSSTATTSSSSNASRNNSSSFIRRIAAPTNKNGNSAVADNNDYQHSSTTSELITTDVMPGMVSVLNASCATAKQHNVVATAHLCNTITSNNGAVDNSSDIANSKVIPPQLFFHPASSSSNH